VSFCRENIIWQSKDGTWNQGFFSTVWVGSESDGYDPEWDVEYDFTSFSWVTTGHKTFESVERAWQGANPGGGIVQDYTPEGDDDALQYDRMARECRDKLVF
jgi:hypothetical protein